MSQRSRIVHKAEITHYSLVVHIIVLFSEIGREELRYEARTDRASALLGPLNR